MKILTILFAILFVGSIFIGTSHAQVFTPYPKSDPSLPEITMQVVARNSNGQLIAYFEPTLWYISDLQGLHKFLDTKEKTIITKDGRQLEQITFVNNYFFTDANSGQVTSEPLYFDGKAKLNPRHDGILMKPGDTIKVYWKILRVP